MKLYKLIFTILIVFFKTDTLLSENNLFNVNNIKLEKKDKTSNKLLANQAIKKGFNELINKILLKEDLDQVSDLSLSSIKQLVTYYQVTDISNEQNEKEFVNFSVTFDKDKIHKLFYKKGISYSEILDKDLFILPILIKENEIFIFNNNYFYENWNKVEDDNLGLIEFILPLENIEIIQKINKYRDDLINLDVNNLLQEYRGKNLALILIENSKKNNIKVYIKSVIQEKNISKSFNFKKANISEKIIIDIKKELINLVKSKNLIDIRTPSFLNVILDLNKNSNLVQLNLKIKNIDLIENVYVQEFNKDFMRLRIKYLGKLDKIINQLKNQNIDLKLIDDQWMLKVL